MLEATSPATAATGGDAMHHHTGRRVAKPHLPPKIDYTRLPDDEPNLDEVFLAVDVTNPAPPGSDGAEASWVVRYGAT
jgi:hypothetical protein